jgi:hypothetical protein
MFSIFSSKWITVINDQHDNIGDNIFVIFITYSFQSLLLAVNFQISL